VRRDAARRGKKRDEGCDTRAPKHPRAEGWGRRGVLSVPSPARGLSPQRKKKLLSPHAPPPLVFVLFLSSFGFSLVPFFFRRGVFFGAPAPKAEGGRVEEGGMPRPCAPFPLPFLLKWAVAKRAREERNSEKKERDAGAPSTLFTLSPPARPLPQQKNTHIFSSSIKKTRERDAKAPLHSSLFSTAPPPCASRSCSRRWGKPRTSAQSPCPSGRRPGRTGRTGRRSPPSRRPRRRSRRPRGRSRAGRCRPLPRRPGCRRRLVFGD
jgi:hypothetical protein